MVRAFGTHGERTPFPVGAKNLSPRRASNRVGGPLCWTLTTITTIPPANHLASARPSTASRSLIFLFSRGHGQLPRCLMFRQERAKPAMLFALGRAPDLTGGTQGKSLLENHGNDQYNDHKID